MDREQLLNILVASAREGNECKSWNSFKQNCEERIDFHGLRMFPFTLEGVDLSGADLRGVSLSSCKMTRCNLSGADLSPDLTASDLSKGLSWRTDVAPELSLENPKWNDKCTTLRYGRFIEADLRGADLRFADLTRADFSGANLSGAILSGAKLDGAVFQQADLAGADFENSVLQGELIPDPKEFVAFWEPPRQKQAESTAATEVSEPVSYAIPVAEAESSSVQADVASAPNMPHQASHESAMTHAIAKAPKAGMSLSELVSAAAQGTGASITQTPNGYMLSVPVASARSQRIQILTGAKDFTGEDIIQVLTICGPPKSSLYEAALRANAKMCYGAIALAKIRGEEQLVLMNNFLAETLDPVELRKAVIEIAMRGDAFEKQLKKGDTF